MLYVLIRYIEFKNNNKNNYLSKFFTEDFEKTINYVFEKQNIRISTLTKDFDTYFFDLEVFTKLDYLIMR